MLPMLEVSDLRIDFQSDAGRFNAVNGISFRLESGEILGLVGESGCGKSVTSLSILRLLGKSSRISGTIRFEGKNLLRLSEKEIRSIRGNEIAMIFQEPMTALNPLQTVAQQVSEPLVRHKKMSKVEAKRETIRLLRQVGIPRPDEIGSSYPHQLSGGMRQRVMIAMALACSPKLLIADEPTTALDVTIQAQILQLLKTICKERGTSVLLITHDLGVVAEMCDRVIVMYAGEIVEEADVRSLFRCPKHPYTIGLLKSKPDLDSDKDRLEPIPGNVPSLGEMPEGCRFSPRCDKAMEICSASPPVTGDGGHRCRCWLYAERGLEG